MTSLSDQLLKLGSALHACQHLWQPEPFLCSASPWSESESKLDTALMALTHDEVETLIKSPELCTQWLKNLVPDYIEPLLAWEPTTNNHRVDISQPAIAAGIPGRKWQQINYFSDLIKPLTPLRSHLDWCSGKGYLATTLEHTHNIESSHCLEIDNHLCCSGRARAQSFNLQTQFHCCDVLQPLDSDLLSLGQRHTALHACGGLHRSMLRQASEVAEQIILAPCCYHLYSDQTDSRLSSAAQKLSLVFDRNTLRLPLLETVTGGVRVQRLRATELIWRLAYENWRVETTGDTSYRSLASVPKAIFNQDPSGFFHWAAQQHGLEWEEKDLESYLIVGRERFLLCERLGIVRQGLKRFLEHLIVLDLGCYLEERGFQVSITEFCPREVTPRNLAIVAVKKNLGLGR